MRLLSSIYLVLVCSLIQTQAQFWNDQAGSLVADIRAHNVGDILTIIIQETKNTSKNTSKATNKTSGVDAGSRLSVQPQRQRSFDQEGATTVHETQQYELF